MKKLALAAAAAVMMAGTTVATTTPADARVVVGIGIGPGFYGPGYYPGRYCDPYSRYYDPYRCDGDYYHDPIFFGGYWYRGPFRYRYWGGHRWFWVNHGWHRNEWHGARPSHMTFHGGWYGHSAHSWSGHNWGGHSGGGHHHH
jgi:hypothetical protein